MPTNVNVEYRKNLEQFYKWEKEKAADNEATIKALLERERPGFRLPRWVVTLAALAVLGAAVWVFRAWVLK